MLCTANLTNRSAIFIVIRRSGPTLSKMLTTLVSFAERIEWTADGAVAADRVICVIAKRTGVIAIRREGRSMSTQHPTDETKKYLVFGQTPVSWTKKLKGAFVSETIYEGRTYFYSGPVSISTGSREYVHASMWNGAGNCTVKISVEGDDSVFVSCTCKVFRKVTVCEHVWATILAAERKGYLGRIGEM